MSENRKLDEQRKDFIRFLVGLFGPFGLILGGVTLAALGITIPLGFLIWAGIGLVAVGLLWALFAFSGI